MENDGQERLRTKVYRIEEMLSEAYGQRVWNAANYIDEILGALIATILSQNTSDLNSGRAYASLREAFPGGWDDVRVAPIQDVVEAIKAGGLAQTKSLRIQNILHEIYERNGSLDLEHLRAWTDDEVREFLRSFTGVGPKTAACVLMFNMGRPALPVDTHVHRVAQRLGFIGPKVGADQAHEILQSLLEPEQVYSFHVHLIEHGRQTCHARRPACGRCPVQIECDAFRNGEITHMAV